ncbi:hypothetical protein HUA74_30175 [Myxococcus sp. CA051A]|uniref:hypothetical protein n=1 Tax=Myxococcus sp. CA051A TaxID=2741739 RepID=UPI00157AEA5D|nr:hypothetical protein [Myxococcus sp. CA051A]NTX64929.1 hypothetical protein [Myxococcus sp. CA051A]
MRRMWSWVAVAGVSLSSVALGDEVKGDREEQGRTRTLRFTKKDAVVGQAEEHRLLVEMKQDFTMTAPDMEPEAISGTSTMVQTDVLTPLAAKGRIVTRAKIAYGEVVEVTTEEGKETRKLSPVNGKAYLGEYKKGRIVVTSLQGKPVKKEEQTAVLEDLDGLGKENPLVAAIPDEPLKVGDSVERLAKMFEAEFQKKGEADDGMTFRGISVRLTEIRQDARGPMGVFSVAATFVFAADEESPVSMEITYQGTMNVLADGPETTSISLAGPMTLTPTPEMYQLGMRVTGKGDSRLVLTTKVLPPPPKK